MTMKHLSKVSSGLLPVSLGLAVFGFGMTGLGSNVVPGSTYLGLDWSANSASAVNRRAQNRRVARRTSRRTSRRVARRNSIAGCSPWNAYFNCGGVYYRPVVENGVTVYVVVNP